MLRFKIWLLGNTQAHIHVCLDRATGERRALSVSEILFFSVSCSALIFTLTLARFLLDCFTEVAGGGLFAIIGCWGSPCYLICRSYRNPSSPYLWLLCRKEQDKARKSQVSPAYVYTWVWHGGCCVAWIQSISLTIHNEGLGREASPGRLFREREEITGHIPEHGTFLIRKVWHLCVELCHTSVGVWQRLSVQ